MKRILLVGMVAAALAMAPKAEAAPLAGALSISAQSQCAGCNAILPVTQAGALINLGAATALDFTNTGAVTAGATGTFHVDNTSGSFNPLFNTTGAIRDFAIVGPGTVNYPYIPVIAFQTAGLGFSFDILTIIITEQNDSRLSLTGTGRFHMTGFDDTLGIWNFQTNNVGGVFSFAGSEGTVPEPGTMVLLGSGLIGLAAAARRMRKA